MLRRTATILLGISFKQKGAYSNKPDLEEAIRKEIGAKVKKLTFDVPEVRITVSEAGAHHGGTDPLAPLHSTCYIQKENGEHITTIHVEHTQTVQDLISGT